MTVPEEPMAKEVCSVELDMDPRSVALDAVACKPTLVAVEVAAASSSVVAVTLRELRKGIIKISHKNDGSHQINPNLSNRTNILI